MLEEKLDVKSHVRQRQRLKAFTESEVWKQDVKPFLIEKLHAAKSGIFYSEDDPVHWKAVGIYAHIEEMLVFVEELELEKALWQKRESRERKIKPNLFGWLKRKKERKPKP